MWLNTLYAALATFLITAIGVGLYRRYAIAALLVDVPNARSSHDGITPRGGGLLLVIVPIIWAVLHRGLPESLGPAFWLAGALIGALGFWDDHRSLSAKFRLLIQAVAVVGYLVWVGVGPLIAWGFSPWLAYPLATLTFLWSINLFNFMDGSDGLAASEGLFILLGAVGLFSAQQAEFMLPWLATTGAAILGFLVWNWPKARLFMGDVGSSFLGFLVMAIAWTGAEQGLSLVVWAILYALFIMDATITLLYRMALKQPWMSPHREHTYQRLLQLGWSHLQVLLSYSAFNTLLLGAAYLAYRDRKSVV